MSFPVCDLQPEGNNSAGFVLTEEGRERLNELVKKYFFNDKVVFLWGRTRPEINEKETVEQNRSKESDDKDEEDMLRQEHLTFVQSELTKALQRNTGRRRFYFLNGKVCCTNCGVCYLLDSYAYSYLSDYSLHKLQIALKPSNPNTRIYV